MITTIIFDLSDVYLRGVSGTGQYLKQKITDSQLLTFELDQLFLGEISEDEFWKKMIKRHSWNIPVKDLKIAVRKNFQEIKGVRDIIEKLKKKGYKFGLLSNHAKEWIQYCEITYKYHHLFDTILYSFEAKLSKPDKEIFKLILKKLDVKAEECLYIDDYIKNIETAKKLNIKTIHFTSVEDLKEKLKKLQIKV